MTIDPLYISKHSMSTREKNSHLILCKLTLQLCDVESSESEMRYTKMVRAICVTGPQSSEWNGRDMIGITGPYEVFDGHGARNGARKRKWMASLYDK